MDEPGREPVEELTLEPPSVVRDRRPPVLWAVLAFIGLVAGGLVVSSAGDDGEPRPGLPVDLSFSGVGAARPEAAADAMLAWVTYVPGDDLPALGGEGTAYRLSGHVDEARVRALADALGVEGEVRSGGDGSWSVTGEGGLGRLDVNAGGGAYWSWFSGHQDCVDADGSVGGCYTDEECVRTGDVTRCTFSATGGAVGGSPGKPTCDDEASCDLVTTTTYGGECGPEAQCPTSSNACAAMPGTAPEPCNDVILVNPVECPEDTAADPDPREECADPAGDSGSDCTADDCIAPDEPAADLPAEDEARRVALEVVEASGADVDDAIVTAEASNAWFVTVEPRLDGVPSGLVSFVEVGADLQVLSGSGPLGDLEELGEYPLLDTRGAIERANQQTGFVGDTPAIVSDTPLATEGTTGGTDTGTDDTTVETAIASDPCAVPEGASDGCGGGTTGCGGDGCIEPTTTIPCKVQADGSEICEVSGCENGTMSCPPAEPCPADGQGATTTVPCLIPECPQPAANGDVAVGAPEVVDCAPPPNPIPLPEPQPVEIVLVDAERSLVVLPATDGSGDAYLVPAYRFTIADGGTVDLPAIADEALAGPATTETTVPDTVEPAPVPVPEPQPCEVLEEQDPESATTHTVQTCPTPSEDPKVLGEGEEPTLGVGYYVDVDKECGGGSFLLGRQIWISTDDAPFSWGDASERFEGGTFTLDAEDHGTFVGDSATTKVGEFRTLQPNEDIFCSPERR